MLAAALAPPWATLVAWLICRAAMQYRAYEVLRPEAKSPRGGESDRVDIIVPARNEAAAIGSCLAGLVAQDYPWDRLAVTVVDDGSSDATVAIARGVAGQGRRVRVIEAGTLPPGWTGKTHACWLGAAEAKSEWLCFIDADTVPEPALLRSAVELARRRALDLLSLEPRQELATVWERLIIPAGLCALGFTGDLRQKGSAAAVNGQFLLVRRSAYVRAGGHPAVRDTVAEDSALATRIKSAGGRIALMSGAPLIAVRMYRSLPQLWEGLTKNVTLTFGGVRATALLAVLGPILAWSAIALPAALAVSLAAAPGPLAAAAFMLAAAASLALFGMHFAAARYFAIPLWYGLLFPVAYSFAAVLALAGIAARRRGRVVWKGREYRVAPDSGG